MKKKDKELSAEDLDKFTKEKFVELMFDLNYDGYFKRAYLDILLPHKFLFANLNQFIYNVYQVAIPNVEKALKDWSILIENVINDRAYYDKDKNLTNFELYLTKYIVAHNLWGRFKSEEALEKLLPGSFGIEPAKLTLYFREVREITMQQGINFEYYIESDPNIPELFWNLKPNKAYVPKAIKSEITFVWKNNPDKQLNQLYKLMVGKFITDDNTLEQFKAIFTGQSIDSIVPIKWHNSNASEILYFITKIHNVKEYDKSKVEFVSNVYEILKSCFVKQDGAPFTAKFKVLNQTIEIKLSQSKQQAITKLLSTF